MKTMNVSKPSSGALEDLIALPSSARKSTTGSGSSGNNTPVLARADHSECVCGICSICFAKNVEIKVLEGLQVKIKKKKTASNTTCRYVYKF